MLPIVFHSHDTQFDTQGYGALVGCTKCMVNEELNGEYTLDMTVYADTLNANRLIPRNIIVCKPNATSTPQPFRIYKTKRSLDGRAITVYARHLSYDLNNYPCEPFTASHLADAMQELEYLGGDNDFSDLLNYPFKFFANMDVTETFSIDVPKIVRSLLMGNDNTITGVYGGEWLFDGWECILLNHRGKEDSGINISYGNNLANYIKEANDTVVAGYVAYYKKNDVYIQTDPIISDPTFTRIKILDVSSEFDETPTIGQVEHCITVYERKNKSNDTLTIEGTPLLSGQTISLGDTVHVTTDEITQFDLRVIKTVWDVLRDDFDKIELGSKKETIATTIKNLR